MKTNQTPTLAILIFCILLFALCISFSQDHNGTTDRFHNGARLTLDPSTSVRDEDGRWTLSAGQLGKLALIQGGTISNDFWQVATITLTNTGGTSNGMTIAYGSDTRTWTNASSATTIATNTTFYGSATNLFNALTTNGFSGLALSMSSTNGIKLTGGTNVNLAASLAISTNWATVTYATNTALTGTANFSPAYSSAPAVIVSGNTNSSVHVIGTDTNKVVFGSSATNGIVFRWLSFGSP